MHVMLLEACWINILSTRARARFLTHGWPPYHFQPRLELSYTYKAWRLKRIRLYSNWHGLYVTQSAYLWIDYQHIFTVQLDVRLQRICTYLSCEGKVMTPGNRLRTLLQRDAWLVFVTVCYFLQLQYSHDSWKNIKFIIIKI